MLASKLKSLGLTVDVYISLRNIWCENKCLTPEAVFVSVFGKNSIVYFLFGLGGYGDLKMPCEGSSALDESLLAEQVSSVARIHGHDEVNEVHLLRALLSMFPEGFSSQFESLGQIRQTGSILTRLQAAADNAKQLNFGSLAQTIEDESRRMENRLASLRDRGNDKLARKIEEFRLGAPWLSRSRVVTKLESYLSSPYYPFGSSERNAYLVECKTAARRGLPTSDISTFFGAYYLRDENAKKIQDKE